ncbi:MAG TPA: PLP-dependent aminotransferase family protein [Rhodanobacteraceae bacterium]|nr:PLP-dependent aminotransferase family protein [Rhodanobacteraceae bacterium]
MLLTIDGGARPLYVRVYEAMRRAILDRRLKPQERLPSTRELALDLGVSRTVVMQAYALLESEGYTNTRGGAGTYITTHLPDESGLDDLPDADVPVEPPEVPLSARAKRAASLQPHLADLPPPLHDPGIIDMRYDSPVADTRALDHWRQAMARTVRRVSLDRDPPAWGLHSLRTVVAEHLRNERGVIADAEDLMIVNGVQQALDLIARVLVEDGTVVGLEEPHYQGARLAFTAAGAQLVACPVDEHGLDITVHRRALDAARMLVVAPSHQFPTGAVMPLARRRALLQWAWRRALYVVEDDIGCEYRYGVHAMPSLQSMDRCGRVIHVSNFARLLFPGLYLGCMVVPRQLRECFREAKWLADRGGPPLQQLAMLNYMASGEYERSRRRMVHLMDQRRLYLIDALRTHLGDAVVIGGAKAGIHLYVRLPELPVAKLPLLLEEARQRKLCLYSAEKHFLGPCNESSLVLGYAGTDASRMDEVGRRLAAAWQAVSEPRKQAVSRAGR